MMLRRRDALIGGACLAAGAGALALTPRNRQSYLHGASLERGIPKQFGVWSEREADTLVTPTNENDLAAKLYSQVVGRMYGRAGSSDVVMLLIAYGDTQNDILQLHRPEICYPAFGFTIEDNRPQPVPIGGSAVVPARALTASMPARVEQITYWTRIGDYLPISGRDQRWARLKTQIAGIIPDGALVRISNISDDADSASALNAEFARDLVGALSPALLPALIGPSLASRLRGRAS